MLLPIFHFRDISEDKKRNLLQRAEDNLSETIQRIIPIVERVKKEGDSALREMTKTWDHIDLENFVLNTKTIPTNVPEALKESFRIAISNVKSFHQLHLPKNIEGTVSGNRLGTKYTPIDSVSIYAPGGKALYPSTIIMGAVPAKLAGVPRIQLVTPPQKDGIPDILIWLCQELGIDQIITVGGAQGIAACAFGTKSIQKTSMVVGPGNSYVAAAKSYLSGLGVILIDAPCGPSEVLILADESANPVWVAADLLSQAEHGEDSIAVLVTTSEDLANAVQREVEKALEVRLTRSEIKKSAIKNNSYILIMNTMEDCIAYSNEFAPEHLEICTKKHDEVFQKITNAGSVFLGHFSPVAMGDYISGTNHVLPTAGLSKMYSPLGTENFFKRMTYQEVTRDSLEKLDPHVWAMSGVEGLQEEHGNSVRIRLKK